MNRMKKLFLLFSDAKLRRMGVSAKKNQRKARNL